MGPTENVCEWMPEDESSDWYNSECGMSFIFNDGSATENGFKFCPRCGKKLKDIPWDNNEE